MDLRDFPQDDQKRITDAAQRASTAMPGLDKELLGQVLEEFGTLPRRTVDPIEFLPMPWLLQKFRKQPTRVVKEIFRRWWKDD